MAPKKELTNTESLCAILLFFFQSGMDAASVVSEGGGGIEVNMPTEDDLETIRKRTPVAMWDSMLGVSEHLVTRIVETEPRNPLNLARESANVVRRGHEFLQHLTSPDGAVRTIQEALGNKRPKAGK
jgi:hypothetical protein